LDTVNTPLNNQTIRIAGWVLKDMLELHNQQVNGTSGHFYPFEFRPCAGYDSTCRPAVSPPVSAGVTNATISRTCGALERRLEYYRSWDSPIYQENSP